jgi:hypothetical protein
MSLWKLAAIVHTVVAPTVMGALVIVALLVPELSNARGIVAAAVVGAVLSFPLSAYVAKRMLAGQKSA